MTYRKRAFTALVAGALALPFLATPANAAHGGPEAPGAQDITQFCTNPFTETFVDVNATDVFAQAIQCIATAGREIGQPITVGGPEGRPANQYGPNLSVRRGQMASFIARTLDAAEQRDRTQVTGAGQIQALPAADNQNRFNDVPANDVHRANINRLAAAGVVLGGFEGRPANTYSPNEFISRAQMASFINRAAAFAQAENPNNSGRGTGFTAPNNANYFVDSGDIAVHQANINGLASVGVVIGVQPTSAHRYAPRDNVSRAQMAGFISRTLSELFDRDRVHSLLETLTGNAEADSRADANRAGNESRLITFAGLNPATEYRVTLVKCENVTRGGNDLVTFARNANGTADTGSPTSRITGTGNSGSGGPIEPTASTTARGDSEFSVFIENPATTAECVVAVIYINGGPGKTLAQGGALPQLEVDGNGRPVEFFGISGRTTFAANGGGTQPVQGQATVAVDDTTITAGDPVTGTVNGNQPIRSVRISGPCIDTVTRTMDAGTAAGFQFSVPTRSDFTGTCRLTFVTTFENGTQDTDTVDITVSARPAGDAAPTITDARIATDAAIASGSGMATGTASAGDVFTITFSEAVATDSSVATGASFSVTDDDGDTAVIVCGASVTANDDVTAATCTIDGAVVTVTLRETADDTNAAGNGEVALPLTITQVRGFFDADEGRQEATTTGSADLRIDQE